METKKQDEIDEFFLLREIRTKEERLKRDEQNRLEDELIKKLFF